MAVSLLDADFGNVDTFLIAGGASPSYTALPTSVPAGATLFIGIRDISDETTTITGISDSVNGAWPEVPGDRLLGPADHSASAGMRSWMAYFINSAAGTIVITPTFSVAIDGRLLGGWGSGIRTDVEAEAVAAISDQTNVTAHVSNSAHANGPGAAIGLLCTNGNTDVTGVGTGETEVTNLSASRLHFTYEPFAVAGDYTLEVTTGALANSNIIMAIFREPGGSGADRKRGVSELLRTFNMQVARGRR